MSRITQIKNLQPRPAIGGYIRIGRSVSGKNARGEYSRPDKLDHFEVTTTNVVKEGAAENFAADVALMENLIATFEDRGELDKLALCGGCDRAKEIGFKDGLPRRMPIVLASDDLSVTFPSAYRWYRGRTVFCEGDGEQAFRREEKAGEKGVTSFTDAKEFAGPCGDSCPDLIAGRCKPNATLNLVAPFQQRVGILYRFSTTSRNSFRSILGGLEWIADLVGTVSWIPLFLEMTERKVQTREGRTAKAWIVSLFFDGTPQELLRLAGEEYGALAQGKRQMRQLLAVIDDVEQPDDQLDVQLAEFAQDGGEVVDVQVTTADPAIDTGDEATIPAPAKKKAKTRKKKKKEPEPEHPAAAERAEAVAAQEPAAAALETSKQEAAEVGVKVPEAFEYSEIYDLLKQADHPLSLETVMTFDHNQCVAIFCWAREEILLLDAVEAGVTYDRRPFPRPSFVPEYGDHEERKRLGMVDQPPETSADRPAPTGPAPPAEPVAAPAPSTGTSQYDADQLKALSELGWDGEGDAPAVSVQQRAWVIERLKVLELIEPAKCLDFISTAVKRPVTTTGELKVTDLLVIDEAVKLVADGGGDVQQEIGY